MSVTNTNEAARTRMNPETRTFFKRLSITVGSVAVLLCAVLSAGNHYAGLERDYMSVISSYDTDGISINKERNNGAGFNDLTLDVAKGGKIHMCKSVKLDDLRAGKSFTCTDGTVISKK